MSIGQKTKSNQDVPPILALIGLGLVVGAYFYMESPTTFSRIYSDLDKYVAAKGDFLASVLFLFSMNGIWVYSMAARSFGLQRQGSRLEVMTGKRTEASSDSWPAIFASVSLGVLSLAALYLLGYPSARELAPLSLDVETEGTLLTWLRVNFAMTIFVGAFVLTRFPVWRKLARLFGRELPSLPKIENGLVLGSVGEENPETKPEWAILDRRALNGNILITGSIGGGKTQGTILPYLDQILSNFNPRPSILAIDPKGTFIPEALKIINRHGLKDHVLHMRLGGNVTFNPIFNMEPLKGARFLDTAQMIRAAAVNFMGKSFDSPFWEISAFNLIKNCLVLCGAKYREV